MSPREVKNQSREAMEAETNICPFLTIGCKWGWENIEIYWER